MGTKEKNTVCEYCGENLSPEEIANPIPEGAICESCYHEHFEFTCYRCQNYDHEDEQHKMLVIAEECGGLPRGVYRITDFPYYTSNYFDMRWNKFNLEWIGPMPEELSAEDVNYPSGHLCRDCQLKIMPPRNFGNPELLTAGSGKQ